MTSIFTFMRDEKGVVMILSARGLASTDSTEVRMMRSQADRITGVIESHCPPWSTHVASVQFIISVGARHLIVNYDRI